MTIYDYLIMKNLIWIKFKYECITVNLCFYYIINNFYIHLIMEINRVLYDLKMISMIVK